MNREPFSPLEMWGGIESTVNRVGDQYFDQVARGGHADRPEDLDRIAALGVRALRYPVLWEWAAKDPAGYDWTWADDRLARLRDLNVRPIVGLVHHGSGPRHTNLLDDGFAPGLADYAGRLAERFPWVTDYTPINEPLTTGRFAGLYGHWYPHGRDGLTFAHAFLNQCRAVVLAMRAVRAVRPDARLVQTEDLGKTHGTPALRYQVDFENERRWMTIDLLCGRIDRVHPMFGYLRWVGVAEKKLGWFLDNPCPPDIVGINHYVTSERFLDERLESYPVACHGGNGRHAYADVEAVRVCPQLTGPAGLMREAWQRYHLPLAVTEAHLGCTREEQLRWFWEVWKAAAAQRAAGIDVRAVTAWALLGSYDWNSLVTRSEGYFEPGAFDLRGPQPRPTALAGLVRELAAGHEPTHPVLASPGWWRRPERLIYPPPFASRGVAVPAEARAYPAGREAAPILIAGAAGNLGRALASIAAHRGLAVRCLGRHEMDIADPGSVEAALKRWKPWAVINAAGYAPAAGAKYDPQRCRRENAIGPAVLARACRRHEAALLTFSSDQVFDGRRGEPYHEGIAPAPLNALGRSKMQAEQAVLAILPSALVVRAGTLFSPWDESHFVATALRTLAGGEPFEAADDVVISPTYVPDLVHACLDLLIDGERGAWHLANRGATTWAALARQAATLAGFDPLRVLGRPAADLGVPGGRARNSVLESRRGTLLPPWEDALARYFQQRPAGNTVRPPVALVSSEAVDFVCTP